MAQLPCWLPRGQQVWPQRWIWGFRQWSMKARGSTLALKPRAEVTRSPKQGYQWPHKTDWYPPKKFFIKVHGAGVWNALTAPNRLPEHKDNTKTSLTSCNWNHREPLWPVQQCLLTKYLLSSWKLFTGSILSYSHGNSWFKFTSGKLCCLVVKFTSAKGYQCNVIFLKSKFLNCFHSICLVPIK